MERITDISRLLFYLLDLVMVNLLFQYLSLFQNYGELPKADPKTGVQTNSATKPANQFANERGNFIDKLKADSYIAVNASTGTTGVGIDRDWVVGTQLTTEAKQNLGSVLSAMMPKVGLEKPDLTFKSNDAAYPLKLGSVYQQLVSEYNKSHKTEEQLKIDKNGITVANLEKLKGYFDKLEAKPVAPPPPATPVTPSPKTNSVSEAVEKLINEKYKHYNVAVRADYEKQPPIDPKNMAAKTAITDALAESRKKLALTVEESTKIDREVESRSKGKNISNEMKEVMKFQLAYNLKNKSEEKDIQVDGKLFTETMGALKNVLGTGATVVTPAPAPLQIDPAFTPSVNAKTPEAVKTALATTLKSKPLPDKEPVTAGGFEFVKVQLANGTVDVLYRDSSKPQSSYTSLATGESGYGYGYGTPKTPNANYLVAIKTDSITTETAPLTVDQTTKRIVQTDLDAISDKLQKLTPGEQLISEKTGRIWYRGEDDKLYYNSKNPGGKADNVWGRLDDNLDYVAVSQSGKVGFMKVTKQSVTPDRDSTFFLSDSGQVFDNSGKFIKPVKINNSDIWELPRPYSEGLRFDQMKKNEAGKLIFVKTVGLGEDYTDTSGNAVSEFNKNV